MNGRLIALALATLLASPTALAEDWKALLERGEKLTLSPTPKVQLRGARMTAKAYKLAPDEIEATAGMCHALFLRSFFTKERKKAEKYARKAVSLARKMIKRWPKRAEGYYWMASSTGLLVRIIGVLDAVSQGLATRVEKAGLKALELDRTLYKGAVPRLLGRYYYLVPWPMKDLDKAVDLLADAYKQDPANVTGMRYLGEAWEAKGDKTKARNFFGKCARIKGVDPEAAPFCKERLSELGS